MSAIYLDPEYPPTVMVCGTAGLSAGATVYPVAVDGATVIVEDTMGREHLVTPGDLAEPPALWGVYAIGGGWSPVCPTCLPATIAESGTPDMLTAGPADGDVCTVCGGTR